MKGLALLPCLLSAVFTSMAAAQPAPPVAGGSASGESAPPPPADAPSSAAETPALAPPVESPAPSPPSTPTAPAGADAVDGLGESYGPPKPTAQKEVSGSPFKRSGQVILGLEHLAGVYSTSTTIKQASSDPFLAPEEAWEESGSSLGFSLLGAGSSGLAAPKLSLDFTVTSGVTLGGSLFFYSASTKTERTTEGTKESAPDRDVSGFGINPRLGLALGEKPIIWLRAGLAYASASSPDGDPTDDINSDISISTTALSLEGALVFMNSRGVGIGIGPSVYVPLSSSLEVGGSADQAEFSSFSWLLAASGYFAP